MHIVDTEEGIKELEEDLRKLQKWSEMNDMKFNTDKCSVMQCGINNKKISINYIWKNIERNRKRKRSGSHCRQRYEI